MTCIIIRTHFEDEISNELKHTGAGIVSMANRCVMCIVCVVCIM